MRRFICILAVCAAFNAWGQEQVGVLLYRTPTGRGMTLEIVSAGPGQASLKPERDDAEKFRLFVQRHCVRESSLDRNAKTLIEPPPEGYISAAGGGPLIRTSTVTYWRYAPGLVLPVRFKCMGQFWELIRANVPARTIN